MRLMDFFRKKSSGEIAKDRLKLLLVSDRANCSPEMMEMIKNDIIQVISKYMDIDAQGLDIQITETESEGSNGVVPDQGYETQTAEIRMEKGPAPVREPRPFFQSLFFFANCFIVRCPARRHSFCGTPQGALSSGNNLRK